MPGCTEVSPAIHLGVLEQAQLSMRFILPAFSNPNINEV
jgi:hypothetical protein